MTRMISHSTEQTEEIARRFAQQLRAGDVVALRGGMGVGKTAFVRGLARGLEVTGEVSSPTFALVHEHEGRLMLYHFDMYRVTTPEDLYSTGFFDYLDTGAVLAVEWSENIQTALPQTSIAVTLNRISEDEREIRIESMDRADTRFCESR